MQFNKYQVFQRGQVCNIYEIDVTEINNEEIISSIRHTVKKYPRLNIPTTIEERDSYPIITRPHPLPDGTEIQAPYFANSSGYIIKNHSQHSIFFKRDTRYLYKEEDYKGISLEEKNIERTDLKNFNTLITNIEEKMKEVYIMEKIDSNMIPKVYVYWCVLYEQGDKTDWHKHHYYHENIINYSSVYYADTDDITPLIIKDEKSNDDLYIIPKKGTIIVFSGYVNHMVPALPTTKERLIVGMDFKPESILGIK